MEAVGGGAAQPVAAASADGVADQVEVAHQGVDGVVPLADAGVGAGSCGDRGQQVAAVEGDVFGGAGKIDGMSAAGVVDSHITESHVVGGIQLDSSEGAAEAESDAVAVFGLGGDGEPVSVHESGVDFDGGGAQRIGAALEHQGDVASRAAGLDAVQGIGEVLVLAVGADGVGADGGGAAAERNPCQGVVIDSLVHHIVGHLDPDLHRVVGADAVHVAAHHHGVVEVAGQVAGVFFRALIDPVERPVQFGRFQVVDALVLEGHPDGLRVGDGDRPRLVDGMHGDRVAVVATRIFDVKPRVGLGRIAESVAPDDVVLDAGAEILLRNGGGPEGVARRGLHPYGIVLAFAFIKGDGVQVGVQDGAVGAGGHLGIDHKGACGIDGVGQVGGEGHHRRLDGVRGAEQLHIVHVPACGNVGAHEAPLADDELEAHLRISGVVAQVENLLLPPAAGGLGEGVVGLPVAVGAVVKGEVRLVAAELALVGIVGDGLPLIVGTQSLLLVHHLAEVAGEHFAYMAEFQDDIFILLAVEKGSDQFCRVPGRKGDVAVGGIGGGDHKAVFGLPGGSQSGVGRLDAPSLRGVFAEFLVADVGPLGMCRQ